eukprot:scaffold3660_cov129-Skeletonema_dohrnii-CCMP3373.AAC.10
MAWFWWAAKIAPTVTSGPASRVTNPTHNISSRIHTQITDPLLSATYPHPPLNIIAVGECNKPVIADSVTIKEEEDDRLYSLNINCIHFSCILAQNYHNMRH